MALTARRLAVLIAATFLSALLLAAFTVSALASGGRRAGVRAAPVTAAELAKALKQETGLEPSQVSTKDVCATAKAGSVACDAEVLVSRATGKTVRPRVIVASASTSEPVVGSAGWIQEAYDLTWLSEHKGSGVTIAVVDAYDDPDALSDMEQFRAEYGLPACNGSSANTTASNYSGCFKRVSQTGSTSSYPANPTTSSDAQSWSGEESLDLDAISTTCPLCTIDLVEANSTDDSDMNAAVAEADSLGAKIISLSWGGADKYSNYTDGSETDTFAGVSTLAASGDDGTEGTGASSSRRSDQQFPAALPGVTAVGGTSLATATEVARGFGESVWDDSSGATGSGCATDVPIPGWQSSSVTDCSGRAYNDVSADADPVSGLDVYNTYEGGWGAYGGTSLATPLLAGFEAVTGIGLSSSTTTANSDGSFSGEWAYKDSALLNDITSGEDGSCTTSIICAAATGWDGPTGNGSISGDLVSGGPGIGAAYETSTSSTSTGSDASNVTATGATLTSGVYPNGLDTSVWWEYGTSSSFGSSTASTDAGSGTAAVTESATLTCLAPNTTYYYRLDASNADGQTDGYTYSFTTASGSACSADTTTIGTTTTGTTTTGTTTAGTTTTGTTTGTSSTMSTTPTTTSTTPATPAPSARAAAKLSGTAKVGYRVYVTGGSYVNATSVRIVLKRCFTSCATIAGAGSGYKLTAADAGAYIRAYAVLSGPGGTKTVNANGLIGPVRSASSAAKALKLGTTSLSIGSRSVRVRTAAAKGRLVLHLKVTKGRAAALRAWVYTLKDGSLKRVLAKNLNGVLSIPRSAGTSFEFVLRAV